ncbi:MAG TPA: hypothetical protein VFU07_04975 [Candidatus Lumbricidophila sp.]|nr:hypothetical protein [Candidatus Lumbricidophila sp.]
MVKSTQIGSFAKPIQITAADLLDDKTSSLLTFIDTEAPYGYEFGMTGRARSVNGLVRVTARHLGNTNGSIKGIEAVLYYKPETVLWVTWTVGLPHK